MFAPDFFGAERYDAKPAVKRVADALRRHGNSVGATMPVAAHGGSDDGHDLPHRHHGRAQGTRDAVRAHVDGESLHVRADKQLLSKHRQLCNAPPSAASIAPQGGVPPMRKYVARRVVCGGAHAMADAQWVALSQCAGMVTIGGYSSELESRAWTSY